MPVAQGIQADIDLQKVRADIAATDIAVANIQAQINREVMCKVSPISILPPCPDLKNQLDGALNNKTMATNKLAQLQAGYPAALKAAIARTWLESVNTARCTRDVLDSG
jgi:hypothetical protein